MSDVTLKNLKKVFSGGVIAVEDFSLEVEDKEFLVLVGPSGCGKSTVLRMIAGLEEPSVGEIMIGGRRCTHMEPKDRDIAMVFQSYALYPHMTVKENLEFGLRLSGKFTRKEMDIRIGEAADVLEIRDLLERKPRALSGGQRQRVALGRAIVRKPKVFLFDEPLSNLDAKMRIQMRVEIGKLHARLQTTMIYVTHDQTEAMTMGDRIVCMKDGKAQQVAPPMTLYDFPANEYVASFIGMPPMNFIDMDVVERGFRLKGTTGKVSIRPEVMSLVGPRSHIRVGVRPEHLELCQPGGDSLAALVEVVEPLGSETLVYASLESGSVVLRTMPDKAPEIGERIYLRPLENRIHLFDPVDGHRLVQDA